MKNREDISVHVLAYVSRQWKRYIGATFVRDAGPVAAPSVSAIGSQASGHYFHSIILGLTICTVCLHSRLLGHRLTD